MAAFLLAIVAGGWVVGNGAVASPAPVRCHAVNVERTSSPTLDSSDRGESVGMEHRHSGHDHRSGDGCPSGGMCCDMFCHVLLAPSHPAVDVFDVSFTSYARRIESGRGSPPVGGPERPPRPVAA